MKADLSKVAFINYEIESVDELIFLPSNTNGSSRQHTLLHQSRRIQRTTSVGLSSSSSSDKAEFSKLTFLNVFDSHKPEDIEKLDRLYLDFKGQLPSRRQLAAIAQSIGIQQSKIKKWFEKRNFESDNISFKIEEDDKNDQFWMELDSKLEKIDNEIEFIQNNFKNK